MHQELMDSAYEKYADNLSSEQWMSRLTDMEKKAVVLGNLNYQVENGGFVQWVDNGYYLDSPILKKILKEIGTETSLKVLKMVEEVLVETNPLAKRVGFFGKYWLCDVEKRRSEWDEDDDEDYETRHSSFNSLDEEYYEINEQFMLEIEEFLVKVSNV